MPSLAQGYGRGLLLGLQLEEAKRRKQKDELSDEFLRERLEDMRFQRKTLMSQLKEQEAEKKRQGEWEEIRTGIAHLGMQPGGSDTVQKLLAEAPESVRGHLYGALDLVPGLTSGEQLKQRRMAEKVEGAPGVRPWYETYLGPEEMRETAKVAGGLEPKAERLKLPTDWLGAPAKEESAVQKWATDWEKHVLGKEEAEKIELYDYDKEDTEKERAQKVEVAKRIYFNKWAKRVPATLRAEVREQVGMDVPAGIEEEESAYTQEQIDGYNTCRDRGGTSEECRLEAGL